MCGYTFREARLQIFQSFIGTFDQIDSIGSILPVNSKGNTAFAIEKTFIGVAFCTQFQTGDVAEFDLFAAFTGGNDNGRKLFNSFQSSGKVKFQLQIIIGFFSSETSGGYWNVLTGKFAHNYFRSKFQSRHLDRIKPDTHTVIAFTENFHIPHPRQTGEGILDIHTDIVGEIKMIQRLAGCAKYIHADHICGLLFGGYTDLLYNIRQLCFRALDRILHIDLGNVRINSRLKGQCKRIVAVIITFAFEIEQIFDPVDLFFNNSGYCFGNNL